MILPSASPVSWLLALAAALAYAAPAAAASRLGAAASRNALLVAWVLHGALLVWGLWGEAPRFGFAPALSMTAWLVLTVYAVERQLFPQMRARWVLAALGIQCCVSYLMFSGLGVDRVRRVRDSHPPQRPLASWTMHPRALAHWSLTVTPSPPSNEFADARATQ